MILDAGSTYTFFTRNPVQFYMTFSNCNSVAMVRLTKQLKVYDFVKQLHKQAGGNNISWLYGYMEPWFSPKYNQGHVINW